MKYSINIFIKGSRVTFAAIWSHQSEDDFVQSEQLKAEPSNQTVSKSCLIVKDKFIIRSLRWFARTGRTIHQIGSEFSTSFCSVRQWVRLGHDDYNHVDL